MTTVAALGGRGRAAGALLTLAVTLIAFVATLSSRHVTTEASVAAGVIRMPPLSGSPRGRPEIAVHRGDEETVSASSQPMTSVSTRLAATRPVEETRVSVAASSWPPLGVTHPHAPSGVGAPSGQEGPLPLPFLLPMERHAHVLMEFLTPSVAEGGVRIAKETTFSSQLWAARVTHVVGDPSNSSLVSPSNPLQLPVSLFRGVVWFAGSPSGASLLSGCSGIVVLEHEHGCRGEHERTRKVKYRSFANHADPAARTDSVFAQWLADSVGAHSFEIDVSGPERTFAAVRFAAVSSDNNATRRRCLYTAAFEVFSPGEYYLAVRPHLEGYDALQEGVLLPFVPTQPIVPLQLAGHLAAGAASGVSNRYVSVAGVPLRLTCRSPRAFAELEDVVPLPHPLPPGRWVRVHFGSPRSRVAYERSALATHVIVSLPPSEAAAAVPAEGLRYYPWRGWEWRYEVSATAVSSRCQDENRTTNVNIGDCERTRQRRVRRSRSDPLLPSWHPSFHPRLMRQCGAWRPRQRLELSTTKPPPPALTPDGPLLRILFIGDSHVRGVFHHFVSVASNTAPATEKALRFESNTTDEVTGEALAFRASFLWDPLLDAFISSAIRPAGASATRIATAALPELAMLPGDRCDDFTQAPGMAIDLQGYDAVVVGIGQWPAKCKWSVRQTFAHAKAVAAALKAFVSLSAEPTSSPRPASLGVRKRTAVWLGGPAPANPHRRTRDFRMTTYRQGVFQHLGMAAILELSGGALAADSLHILDFFSASLPHADDFQHADGLHYDGSALMYALVDEVAKLLCWAPF